jgi:hypothetical protein
MLQPRRAAALSVVLAFATSSALASQNFGDVQGPVPMSTSMGRVVPATDNPVVRAMYRQVLDVYWRDPIWSQSMPAMIANWWQSSSSPLVNTNYSGAPASTITEAQERAWNNAVMEVYSGNAGLSTDAEKYEFLTRSLISTSDLLPEVPTAPPSGNVTATDPLANGIIADSLRQVQRLEIANQSYQMRMLNQQLQIQAQQQAQFNANMANWNAQQAQLTSAAVAQLNQWAAGAASGAAVEADIKARRRQEAAARAYLEQNGPSSSTFYLHGTNLCMDVGSSELEEIPVRYVPCNGSEQQKWLKVGRQFISMAKPAKCLDVRRNQSHNGAILQTVSCSAPGTNSAQEFEIDPLRNINGKCVDFDGVTQNDSEGKVQLWDCFPTNPAYRPIVRGNVVLNDMVGHMLVTGRRQRLAESCFANGKYHRNGTMIQRFAEPFVNTSAGCQSEWQTCQNGTWTGSYTYSSCKVNYCYADGSTDGWLPGAKMMRYTSPVVPYGRPCGGALVTCENGQFTGINVYPYKTCTQAPPSNCTFNGAVVPHMGQVTAYAEAITAPGQPCREAILACGGGGSFHLFSTRTGIRDVNVFKSPSCIATPPLPPPPPTPPSVGACTFHGIQVPHGLGIRGYVRSMVVSPETCQWADLTCQNSVLQGANNYPYAACEVRVPPPPPTPGPAGSNCTFNNRTYIPGSIVVGFKTPSVPYGSQCERATMTCENGVFAQSNVYAYDTCDTDLPLGACTLNGALYMHGQSATFYRSTNGPGSVCSTETRTCTNGVLSGSFELEYCPGPLCSFNGRNWVPGARVLHYKTPAATVTQPCEGKMLTCEYGAFTGAAEYPHPACTPLPVSAPDGGTQDGGSDAGQPPAPDGGTRDGGTDAGQPPAQDGGTRDGGSDGGSSPTPDGGTRDGGSDGGSSPTSDGGTRDGGSDAGQPPPDGGTRDGGSDAGQ